MEPLAFMCALFIALLWGIQSVSYKILYDTMHSNSIMIFSWLMYSTIMFAIMCMNRDILWNDYKKITNKEIGLLIVGSILTGCLANYLYYYLLEENETHTINSITCASPLFTLLFAYMLLEESVNSHAIIGTILIISGIIICAVGS